VRAIRDSKHGNGWFPQSVGQDIEIFTHGYLAQFEEHKPNQQERIERSVMNSRGDTFFVADNSYLPLRSWPRTQRFQLEAVDEAGGFKRVHTLETSWWGHSPSENGSQLAFVQKRDSEFPGRARGGSSPPQFP
jgi:hypothetical protein